MRSSFKIALVCSFLSIVLFACERKGCTDQNANNYERNAEKDDGSCIYLSPRIENLEFHFNDCKPPYSTYFTFEIRDSLGNETYEWDFGDGNTSDLELPIHNYQAGNFIARLTVKNPNGSQTVSIPIELKSSYPLTAFFEDQATNNNYRVPAKIRFDNISRYASNYFWEFGEGTTSSQFSPEFIYNSPGRYKVKLHAICKGDTVVYEKNIDILSPPNSLSIKQIKVWLNPGYIPDTLNDPTFGIDPFVDMLYNNRGQGATETFYDVRGFPVSWFLPQDLFGGTYVFDNLNFGSAEEIRLNIVDDEALAPANLLTFVSFFTRQWQDDFYPDILEWDDPQDQFRAFIIIESN